MMVPTWLHAGLSEQTAKLNDLYSHMLQDPPTEAQADEFFRTLTTYHELRQIGLKLAPVQEAIGEALPSDKGPSAPDVQVVEVVATPASDPDRGIFVGTFIRRARGGVIAADIGQEITMTEGRYQQMFDHYGLEHGDRVQAKAEGMYYDTNTPKYYFTILDRCGKPNEDRIETYGALDWRNAVTPFVRMNDLDLLLELKDVAYHNVNDGDVVQIAYMKSEIHRGEVRGYILRKLTDEEVSLPSDSPRRLGPRRKTCGAKPSSPVARFEGAPSILVIGGRNWPFFRDGLELYGAGATEWLDGYATYRGLENKLASFDLVVVLKDYCSHENHDKAKAKSQKDRLHVTTLENWSGFRDQLLVPTIIPTWNNNLVSAAG